MERNEPIPLLGLALRGGRLAAGEDAVTDTVRAGKARLLLLASDASDRTRRYTASLAAEGQVLLLSLPCTKGELGRGLGRGDTAVAALTDAGLAAAVGQRLAMLDPAAYGDAAERLELKLKRARERRENRGRDKNADVKKENRERGKNADTKRENHKRGKNADTRRENRGRGKNADAKRDNRERGKDADAMRAGPVREKRDGPGGPGRRKDRKPDGQTFGGRRYDGRKTEKRDHKRGFRREEDIPGGAERKARNPENRKTWKPDADTEHRKTGRARANAPPGARNGKRSGRKKNSRTRGRPGAGNAEKRRRFPEKN